MSARIRAGALGLAEAVLRVAALVVASSPAIAQDAPIVPEAAREATPAASLELRVGNWIEARGKLAGARRFEAESIEVQEPQPAHVLIGTVERVDRAGERFFLLGQEVHVSDKTAWSDDLSLARLDGKRVKVEGHYRGPAKLSARSIASRGAGRDRLSGRVDAIASNAAGIELSVIGYTVLVPAGKSPASEKSIGSLPLAPLVEFETGSGVLDTADEDVPRGSIRLSDELWLGGIVEYKGEREDDLDLDHARSRDRIKQRFSIRPQITWAPSERFRFVASPRFELEDRRRLNSTDSSTAKPHVNELYAAWTDAFGTGFDVLAGRSLFDDGREWVYKRDLDGVRVHRAWEDFDVELSWTTVVDDGEDRDKHSRNWIAYLSNGSVDRHLAVYVVDRRDERSPREYPLHFGARAIGEFVPNVRSWTEVSLLRGFADDVNLRGYGFDLGATWKPDPWRFTLGYAFGSGDHGSTTGTDEAFRQTGLQNDNDKVGGPTSIRYYGEVVDPELSNMGILTAGVGVEVAHKTGLELLWHRFRQDEASAFLRDTNLDATPSGLSKDLGQELDLVIGSKFWSGLQLELVLGRFDPGDAFPGADPAWIATFQTRVNF